MGAAARRTSAGYRKWAPSDSPVGQTGGNAAELESKFILLGLPL